MSSFLTIGRLATLAVVLGGVIAGNAPAQSDRISDVSVGLTSHAVLTGSTPRREHERMARTTKASQLVAFAAQELGSVGQRLDVANGFTVTGNVRYTRSVSVDHQVSLTFIPVVSSRNSRFPGASAVLMHARYHATPSLDYSRLLIRYGNNGAMVEEFSLRKDGRVTKMAAKHGDCLFRSSLRITQSRAPNAFTSLDATFQSGARETTIESLRRMYDTSRTAVGQRTLFLYSAILVSSNLEEEWNAAYIDGTLNETFKPLPNDSGLQRQIKEFAKELAKNLLKEAGKYLWKAIAAWLGF